MNGRPPCPACDAWPVRRVPAFTAGARAWLCGCGYGWEAE